MFLFKTNREVGSLEEVPMKSKYHHPALQQLADQQKRYAPIERRVEQTDRAEQLLARIDSSQSYKYQSLCEHLTGYRPDKYPDLVITGEDLLHDLRLFVEDLSASAKISVDEVDEHVFTVDDLSERYNVSTKTVDP